MNKKLLSKILIIETVLAAGYFSWVNRGLILESEDQVSGVVDDALEVSVFENKLTPIYGNPVRLYAPKAGIDAEVLEVGVDENGGLETPSSWNILGWYKRSSKTGESGNLIIDGHYDDNHGRPAAFWNLKNLKADDKVYLVDSYGRVYTYRVFEVFFLDIADPNRLEVLEDDGEKPSLTLITCGGVWITGKSTYDKRLVVKAERV